MALFKKLFGRGGSKPLLDQTEAILGRHLDSDFIVFPMAESAQSVDQVEAAGSKLGVTFPPEFVALICGRFPGIYIEVKEEVWPRPKTHEVGPFWSFLYALHTFTTAPESESWMRLDCAAKSIQAQTGLSAAPILQIVGDSDLYCVNEQGEIVQLNHETNELEPVALGFWELLEREVSDLKARKNRKMAQA